LSDQRDSCVIEACSLFILDKGKPVARPGRKVKGRRIVSGGSLTAERVTCIVSASGGEGVLLLLVGILKVKRRPAPAEKTTGASPDGPKKVFDSGRLPPGSPNRNGGIAMKSLAQRVHRFLVSEDGPTAVEYAVMLALIVIVCLTGITAIGTRASSTFNNISTSMSAS
jgi:pilus assembly protein Flp/PilA